MTDGIRTLPLTIYQVAAQQLLTSPDFLAFCEKWKEDEWCPAPFADWLLEESKLADGLDQLAYEAAVWATKKEPRTKRNDSTRRLMRTCPWVDTHSKQLFLCVWSALQRPRRRLDSLRDDIYDTVRLGELLPSSGDEAHSVPVRFEACMFGVVSPVGTWPQMIAWYLTSFDPGMAALHRPDPFTSDKPLHANWMPDWTIFSCPCGAVTSPSKLMKGWELRNWLHRHHQHTNNTVEETIDPWVKTPLPRRTVKTYPPYWKAGWN